MIPTLAIHFKSLIDSGSITKINVEGIVVTGQHLAKIIVDHPRTTDVMVNCAVWIHLIADHVFAEAFDPIAKHGQVMGGLMGTIYGIKVWTDAFCDPDQQFTERGVVYLLVAEKAKSAEDLLLEN